MATQSDDKRTWQRWQDISREGYTRLLGGNPTTGRYYHHLAVLARPQTQLLPEEDFEATVSQFFYYTKSLVVEIPYLDARKSLLTLSRGIDARSRNQAKKPASIPLDDKDYFLTAVSHLLLASLEPETSRENGFEARRNDHIQTVYAALENIKIGGSTKTSRICPRYVLALWVGLLPPLTDCLQPSTRPLALPVATRNSPC